MVTFLTPLGRYSLLTKGSLGHAFTVCIHTENQNQGGFYPYVLLEISVLNEPPLGHLRYRLTDVPPQPNSPPDNVFDLDQYQLPSTLTPEVGSETRLYFIK